MPFARAPPFATRVAKSAWKFGVQMVCQIGIRFAIVQVGQSGAVDYPIRLYGVEQSFKRATLKQVGLQDMEGGVIQKVVVGYSIYFVRSGGTEGQI